MAAANQPTRREFLKGRAAIGALAGVLGVQADEPGAESSILAPRSSLLLSASRQAMACNFEVQFAAGDSGALDDVLAALDLVETLEGQLTIYRADSEVIRINRQAADGPVPVEPRLFGLFELAQRLYRETGGALDITSGPLSEAWGFSRRAGRWPDDEELSAALARVGMDRVELDPAYQSVRFRSAGTTVNFNSIGKGYALDRMAELLAERGLGDYLLHGGRSSVLARGNDPGANAAGGWSIGLRHPLRPEERLGEIVLRDGALATSGSGTQYFEHDGRRYGHLVNPTTGRPAEGVFTATVIAPTAAEADALSTAFYILGPEGTGRYCEKHPEISALLVCPAAGGDSAEEVRLWPFGLEGSRWRPSAG